MKRSFKFQTLSLLLLAAFGNISHAQNTFPANGNVGIGLASPQTKLHMIGSQLFIQNSGEARLRLFNNGGQAEWLLGQRSATEHNFSLSRKIANAEMDFISITPQGRFHISGPEYLYLLNTNGVIIGREFGGTGNLSVQGNLTMSGPSQYILGTSRIHVNGPEYFYVLNNAGMVIGKEGGGTGNLMVQGSILASKVKVAALGSANWNWADYVFEKGYQLKSLPQVEAYIKANKHLEGIPTSEEIAKSGLDIAPVTAKLLEKIEEMTLYMIDLKKENEAMKTAFQLQQKEMEALKRSQGLYQLKIVENEKKNDK